MSKRRHLRPQYVCFWQVIRQCFGHILIGAHAVIEPVVGPPWPFIPISWHYLNGAFCLLWNKIVGPIVGHHLNLGPLILDHLLLQMGLIVASESIYAQGTPRHLERHGKHAQPCEGIWSQVMNL